VNPTDVSEAWTHKELFAHLRAKSVKFRDRPDSGLSVWMVFVETEAEENTMFQRREYMKPHGDAESSRVLVRCQKMDDSDMKRSRDWVGVAPTQRFVWGRFAFQASHGAEPHLERIKSALK
jgi:hypothetical protein